MWESVQNAVVFFIRDLGAEHPQIEIPGAAATYPARHSKGDHGLLDHRCFDLLPQHRACHIHQAQGLADDPC